MNNKQIVAKYLEQNRKSRKIIRRLGHKRQIPVQITEFVCITDIVPEKWRDWFFAEISTDAPFSWGDNNRTLVTIDRFADHCEECLTLMVEEKQLTEGAKREWLKKVRNLDTMYVDLEN